MGVAPANAPPNGGRFAATHSSLATTRMDVFDFVSGGTGPVEASRFHPHRNLALVFIYRGRRGNRLRRTRKSYEGTREASLASTTFKRHQVLQIRCGRAAARGLGVVLRAASVSREAGFGAFRVKKHTAV